MYDTLVILYLFSIATCYYDSIYIDFLIVIKKLPKYFLISIFFKLIINGVTTILTIFGINPIYFFIFLFVVIFWNFCFSVYKEEYIITFFFIGSFWYIMSNYILLDNFIHIYKDMYSTKNNCFYFNNFLYNYDNLLSFNLSFNYDFYSKNLELNIEFNFFKFIFNIFKPWLNIELEEIEEYDVLGGVQKQIIKKIFYFSNLSITSKQPYFYEFKSYVDYSFNISYEDICEDRYEEIYGPNKNKEYIRSLFFEKMREEGGFLKKSLNLSLLEELEQVTYELDTYETQKQKFKDIIINIDQKKENFYPSESKILFFQYIEVIQHLLKELNLRKLNIISNIPLPEQTEEEIEYLTKSIEEIKNSEPKDILLPVQTEEEINSLLESEDFMSDALNYMNMFSEDKSN